MIPESTNRLFELSGTRSMQTFFPLVLLLGVTVTSGICLNLFLRKQLRAKSSFVEAGLVQSLSNLGVGSRQSCGCKAFNILDSTSIKSP
uniref:DNA binding protein n=1 Tax=Rhizophora mucronata TaxID=61149 RepID=A0A2P2MJR0_RHIMU